MLFLSSVAYFLILLYFPNYEIFEYIIFLHSLSNPKALSVYCDKEEEMYWACCKQSTFETPEHNSHLLQVCNYRLDDPVYRIHSSLQEGEEFLEREAKRSKIEEEKEEQGAEAKAEDWANKREHTTPRN